MINGRPSTVAGPPAEPMVPAAAVAALACCAPPAAVIAGTEPWTTIVVLPTPARSISLTCGSPRAASYMDAIWPPMLVGLKPASTPSPDRVLLLKFLVVWNATTRGTEGPSLGSDVAASRFSSSVRTAASMIPDRAAPAILAFTAGRLARKASATWGTVDFSRWISGCLSEDMTICSIVFLSRAALALGAFSGRHGAAGR